MKKAIVAFGLVVMSLSAFAQKDATSEERAQKQTAQLAKKLELTKEQETKIYELNLAQIKNREENKQQDREQFKAEREKYQTELAAILTPEQQEKLKALREEERKSRGQGNGGERRGRPQE